MRHFKDMQTAYIIPGYGVPRRIERDENYRVYLGSVFNVIFRESSAFKLRPQIIFTGGPTDCFPPYRRTEARVMRDWFAQRLLQPSVRQQARRWRLRHESHSLSTVENLVFTRRMLMRPSRPLTIFCEWTRRQRVASLARRIFPGPVRIIPIDFDQSDNRYENSRSIRRREQLHLLVSKLVLTDPAAWRSYHRLFVERLRTLRRGGGKQQVRRIAAYRATAEIQLRDILRTHRDNTHARIRT